MFALACVEGKWPEAPAHHLRSAVHVCTRAYKAESSTLTNSTYRGLPHVTTTISSSSRDAAKSYFCADNFTDADAKVFCKMKSWEFGKAVSLPAETPSGKVRLSSPRCEGSEPHILDCRHESDVDPACTTAAAVECSPGFPFTLRMHNSLAGEIEEAKLAIG